MYAIYNNATFIAKTARSQLVAVSDSAQALQWKAPVKANNVVKSLPKTLRGKGYRVVQVENGVVQQEFSSPPDVGIETMREALEAYLSSAASLRAMYESCRAGFVYYERLQQDLLHQLELGDPAIGNLTHLGAELRKCRVARRKYKDMLSMLHELLSRGPSGVPETYLDDKLAAFSGRQYAMRTQPGIVIKSKE